MIAIVDYGMGNLRSVQKGFEKVGYAANITDSAADLAEASGIVLPGVGAFDPAARNLREKGLWEPLLKEAKAGKPLLGICLGFQLLFDGSNEGEGSEGLGLMPGRVVRFEHDLKTPHMGWNQAELRQTDGIFSGVEDNSFFYFVHSYYPAPTDDSVIAAVTDYGCKFVSAVQKDNISGAQFHPEKSQQIGLKMLSNFGRMTTE